MFKFGHHVRNLEVFTQAPISCGTQKQYEHDIVQLNDRCDVTFLRLKLIEDLNHYNANYRGLAILIASPAELMRTHSCAMIP